MNPGHTRLTLIPCGASSAETLVVRPICPCFEATYAEPVAKPRKGFTEPPFTIGPPCPPARIARASYCKHRKVPFRFVSRTRSHSCSAARRRRQWRTSICYRICCTGRSVRCGATALIRGKERRSGLFAQTTTPEAKTPNDLPRSGLRFCE